MLEVSGSTSRTNWGVLRLLWVHQMAWRILQQTGRPATFDQNTLSSQYGSSLLFVKIGDLVMCIRFIMVLDDVWSGLCTHYIPITGMIWCCCFPHRLEHKLSTGAWPGSGSISQRPRASAPVTIHPKKARAARSIPRRSWPGLPIFPKLLGTFGGMNWEAWANYGNIRANYLLYHYFQFLVKHLWLRLVPIENMSGVLKQHISATSSM